MNKFSVAVFVVLGFIAASAMGASIRKMDYDPKTILAQIDQTPFGNTLLSMVAVHMSTNGPVEELTVLMSQIQGDLHKDQEEDDETNRTNQANCDTVIASYQRQIAEFTEQRNENIKIRDINQAALNVAQKDLAETIAALNLNARRLSEGQANRDQEHNDYAARMLDHETGIKALDGAIQLIQHLQSGTSFVQLKRRFEVATAELIEASKKSKKGHLYTPLITALADLASKATPEMISKILTLFNDLRATFVAEKQNDTNVENSEVEAWTSLRADLETEKDQLTEKRADLERQIEGYTRIITEANKNIAYLTQQIDIATTNLNAEVEDCNDKSVQYAKRSNERTRELDIIGRVIEYFTKRVAAASEFVKSRVEESSF